MKGRKFSEATKKLMSDAAKKRCLNANRKSDGTFLPQNKATSIMP